MVIELRYHLEIQIQLHASIKIVGINKSCESVVNLILKMNSIRAFLLELMWAHVLEEQLSNYKIVVSPYFDQATGKALSNMYVKGTLNLMS